MSAEAVAAHLGAHVEGTSVPFGDDEIARATDMPRIRKAYKLKDPAAAAAASKTKKARQANGGDAASFGDDIGGGAVRERKEIEIAVLAMMALKGS